MKIEIEIDSMMQKALDHNISIYGMSRESFILTAMRTQVIMMGAYSLEEMSEILETASRKINE